MLPEVMNCSISAELRVLPKLVYRCCRFLGLWLWLSLCGGLTDRAEACDGMPDLISLTYWETMLMSTYP